MKKENKNRFRTWKSGKKWLFAGALITVILANSVMPAVFADPAVGDETPVAELVAPSVADAPEPDAAADNTASAVTAAPAPDAAVTPDTIVLGGIEYQVTVADPGYNPFFANTLTNTSTGQSYTYSFADGSASTSRLYVYGAGGNSTSSIVQFDDMTVSRDASGRNVYSHYGTKNDVTIAETMIVYPDGRIVHEFTAKNDSAVAISDLSFAVRLDTMLIENDEISIFADGNGGSYIQSGEGVTLWNQPISNVEQFAGPWSFGEIDWADYSASSSHASAGQMTEGYDTAIAYRTATTSIEPGQSYSFSFQERLYTEFTSQFDPQPEPEPTTEPEPTPEPAPVPEPAAPQNILGDLNNVSAAPVLNVPEERPASVPVLPATGESFDAAPFVGFTLLAGILVYGANRVIVKAKK